MFENIQELVEDKLIDWIVEETEGRVVCTKPEKGADLFVQKKGDYPGKALSFKLEFFVTPADDEHNFTREIKKETIRPAKDFYFIFFGFDEISQKISEKIWLVPSEDFAKTDGKFFPELFKKYVSDRKQLGIMLIDKLILENKPKPKAGFKPKVF